MPSITSAGRKSTPTTRPGDSSRVEWSAKGRGQHLLAPGDEIDHPQADEDVQDQRADVVLERDAEMADSSDTNATQALSSSVHKGEDDADWNCPGTTPQVPWWTRFSARERWMAGSSMR